MNTTMGGARHDLDLSWMAMWHLADIARHAGEAILARRGAAREVKDDGSPVTQADRAAEEIICAALTAWDSTVPIISEETPLPDPAVRRSWRRYWLVDPLDGTKEFLAGLPEFTVNIALIDDRDPVMAVVSAPALNTVYVAARGLGTWRQLGDDPPTRLSIEPPDPNTGLIIVESRSHPSARLERLLAHMPVRARVQAGSSLKFCWLAEGRAHCYPRLGPTMAWDVAAGDCVFRHATNGDPHESPLTYDPVELRQAEFVIGVGLPSIAPHLVTADQRDDLRGDRDRDL